MTIKEPRSRPSRRRLFLFGLGLLLVLGLILGRSQRAWTLEAAQTLYEAGRYPEAAAALEQTIATTPAHSPQQAVALSNLALVYQELGQFAQAERAIVQSVAILKQWATAPDLLAQALLIQGQLQLRRGDAETAYATWQAATQLAQTANLKALALQGYLNQAQALQTLGLYRQALRVLTQTQDVLATVTDWQLRVTVGRSLGNTLRVLGNFDRARVVLADSLTLAEQAQLPREVSATLLSLGNTVQAANRPQEALAFYQRAAATAPLPQQRIQAQLNQLALLIDLNQADAARALLPSVTQALAHLPTTRSTLMARINLAHSQMRLGNPGVAPLLITTAQQAAALGDHRSQSYALGGLGAVYERAQQWQQAQRVTQEALAIAQAIGALEIVYRWQWQLGRILKAQGDIPGAIAAYNEAVNTLQGLRSDLAAISADVQYSFREQVEPIYRQLVGLLLQSTVNPAGQTVGASQAQLERARQVIESLQVAELDNFFRDACLEVQPRDIDRLDPKAAVIYPIILSDRLEVILALPNQPLRQYTTNLAQDEVREVILDFRSDMFDQREEVSEPLTEVYDWLIRPVAADLEASGVETLVFVLDSVMRNIPMAALSDGEHFLLERYNIAVAPGLYLLDSRPLTAQRLQVLAAGLSEARQGFEPLPGVAVELETIAAAVPSRTLYNEAFTVTRFEQTLGQRPYPIVHLATHGQFSSEASDTFVLTWDSKITAQELDMFLRGQTLDPKAAIELLVLSACETARGNDRAALGLAGVAVRAGARSTIASLWLVSDEATSLMMRRLYQELAHRQQTKVAALRQAQLSVLQDERFRSPYYWAAFILVGNWL
ncbi:CHAT domain-containing protein [Trichothermofontia sichuanensis B231]|uniref:CHAT domain-containing protein n=1 Tax=Trichothermofontia sichuanensis TaxID=3045816 RepID=UPI0022452C5F|nr:CHAT domain-containing protein [Trichothermofontia sichuanensis]UZQ55904.1 CHAT domain-containing protein [Trichothermofontia sichuanensis B231]